MCRQPGCISDGKSIPRAKIEGALETLVRSLAPARELIDLVSAMFRDLWDRRATEAKERRSTFALEKIAVERKISGFLDRIIDADNPTVIGTYERKSGELEREKLVLAEKIAKCGTPLRGYD